DTAVAYQNHLAVAAACQATGLAPRALVVTTKVWPLGFHGTLEAVLQALRELDGVAQVVALLHAPGATPISSLTKP
ncbi:unnamed protein product, partial [Polarella glacialis]